jgi:NADPH-dependent curcumin reductase CurA
MALPVTHIIWKDYVEEGRVTTDDFVVSTDAAGVDPGQLKEGQILMELLYLSVDPYMRGRMRNTKVHTVQR